MLEQIRAINLAIEKVAESYNKSTKKYLSLIGEEYTQGEVSYDLIKVLNEMGYILVKKL